jgi:hypothetical protein
MSTTVAGCAGYLWGLRRGLLVRGGEYAGSGNVKTAVLYFIRTCTRTVECLSMRFAGRLLVVFLCLLKVCRSLLVDSEGWGTSEGLLMVFIN